MLMEKAVTQPRSTHPVLTTPTYLEYDSAPGTSALVGQFERSFVIHNFTNQMLYARDLHDFVSVIEPDTNLRPRRPEMGQHVEVVEKYIIRGTEAAVRVAALCEEHVAKKTINGYIADAYMAAYKQAVLSAQARYGAQLKPERIKNLVIAFSLMQTYSLETLQRTPASYIRYSSLVIGLTSDALDHVYPNSEFVDKTKDLSNTPFHPDEIVASIRLVDNHREIGDQYIWMLGSTYHIPAVVDTNVASGFYVLTPRACSSGVAHKSTHYSFEDGYKLFKIRATKREAELAGNPDLSEEVMVKKLEKETKIISAQNKKEEAEDDSLKAIVERFIRIQTHDFEQAKRRDKAEQDELEQKRKLEHGARLRDIEEESRLRRLKMEEEERRRRVELDEVERRRKIDLEEEDRRRKMANEDIERRIKLEAEQRRVELDRITQLNKLNTEKRLSRNKEKSERFKMGSDMLKNAPAIILGIAGIAALFMARSRQS